MYLGDGRERLEIEGVVIVVCVVVCGKGCEVGVMMYVEYGDRVE